MNHSEFRARGQELIKTINEMSSFALELDDDNAFRLLMKAKKELINAGSSINATVVSRERDTALPAWVNNKDNMEDWLG